MAPGLYLVSAVSTGYSSHSSINDATGNYNSISDAYAVEKDKPQKIEVKDGYFVHIFEGSGLCASSWKLLQAYPRNADNPVLYPGAERALTDGTYSATARENSVQHITAENYLVKAVKGKTSSGNQRFLWEYHVHGTSSLYFNLCRRL